ncbi:MAG: hypothetical protein M1832_002881 [Thelocarpon impressellum]|nr:MAG: hypothetical protein M1832_002881 [Thelocarpon impressellum]
MKLLKHIRSRSKLSSSEASTYSHDGQARGHTNGRGTGIASRLPPPVLERIFSLVCPHACDESYDDLEASMIEDGCMLCDMRDLAACSAACRGWSGTARSLLYHSVRIDAVHYCEREIELAEKRKRRSFFERNADPRDVPQERLQNFSRTVRANPALALSVHFLKMPFMTRETGKADLARTVSVLPNLRYVDLPDSFAGDSPSSHALRQELQARCPDMRKMRYAAGGEQSFVMLAGGRHWQALEVLELERLSLEAATFLRVLGSLPILHELRLTSLAWLDDSVFDPIPTVPPFPPLQRLTLNEVPLTAAGMARYLSRVEVRENLSSLTLTATGILSNTLHEVTTRAPYLARLSITEAVSRSFPLDPTPPLASSSLTTLHYEITNASSSSSANVAQSHYDYLTSSLHAAALPALRSLYVRDADFPETLILAPPSKPFASKPSFSKRGFNQALEVYSKGLDELEWSFTSVSPPDVARGKRGSFTPPRPISAYNLTAGGGLGSPGDLRKSVVVGNGFGGFLAVPSPGAGPGSPGKRGSRADIWR